MPVVHDYALADADPTEISFGSNATIIKFDDAHPCIEAIIECLDDPGPPVTITITDQDGNNYVHIITSQDTAQSFNISAGPEASGKVRAMTVAHGPDGVEKSIEQFDDLVEWLDCLFAPVLPEGCSFKDFIDVCTQFDKDTITALFDLTGEEQTLWCTEQVSWPLGPQVYSIGGGSITQVNTGSFSNVTPEGLVALFNDIDRLNETQWSYVNGCICVTDTDVSTIKLGPTEPEVVGYDFAEQAKGPSPLTVLMECFGIDDFDVNDEVVPPSVCFYEKIAIWAEESGGLADGSSQFSFGNGATGFIGVPLAEDWEIYAVGSHTDDHTGNNEFAVTNVAGGGAADLVTFTANSDTHTELLATPVAVAAGDVIGFRTVNENGNSGDTRLVAYLRREVCS